MSEKYGYLLIAGGVIWSILWTFHTVAHGPLNPAPETGTFLGLTSMVYAVWMMSLSAPLIMLGWVGFSLSLKGGLKRVRTAGVWAGAIGLSLSFASGCIGVAFFLGVSIGKVGMETSWFIGSLGHVVMLLGLLLFGIGSMTVSELDPRIGIIPLIVAIAIPFIAYLRRPGSPLLEWGDSVGYLLLDAIGVIFGLGWAIIGLFEVLGKTANNNSL